METTRKVIRRVLALVAVVGAFVAVYAVVQAAMPEDENEGGKNTPGRQQGATGQNGNGNRNGNRGQNGNQKPTPKFYTVQSGDLLGQIAARYNVRIQDILRLNPGLDAQALTIDQRIQLRQ